MASWRNYISASKIAELWCVCACFIGAGLKQGKRVNHCSFLWLSKAKGGRFARPRSGRPVHCNMSARFSSKTRKNWDPNPGLILEDEVRRLWP